MTDLAVKLGKKIKKIRLRKHMSQAQLAKILGVHPMYISGAERGLRNMTLKSIEKLADALNVPPNNLL